VSLASGKSLPLLALLAANGLLSFGPAFVREAQVGPVAAGFWRMALALPLLLVVARGLGDPLRWPGAANFWLIAAAGLFFALDIMAWHYGIFDTKLANANLLGNSTSFLLPLWVFISTQTRPSRQEGLALGLAGLGALLLMGQSFELSPRHFRGDLLSLLAGILYTFYLVIMARARGTMGAWPVLGWSTLISAGPLLIFAIAVGEPVWPEDWQPVILLALCSQVLGQGFMIYALGKVPPLLFGLSLLIQPILSALLGWLRYGEALALADWGGAILIGAALVLLRR
jgi:drug/metabolite transporter (DMT)-like permease